MSRYARAFETFELSHDGSTLRAATALAFTLALCAAASLGVSLPILGQVVVFAVLTAVVGIPHGGLDHRFGRAVCRPRVGGWWPLAFFSAYLGVASLVLAGWVLAPLTTIAIFFVLSAIHFGDEGSWPLSVVEGGMVIWVPFLTRPRETTRLLVMVTPGHLSESITSAAYQVRPLLWSLALVSAGGVMRLVWVGVRDRDLRAVLKAFRLTAFAVLFAVSPVLLGFMTFFCGWHSTRELADLAVRVNPSRPWDGLLRVIRMSAPLSALLIVAIGLAGWWRLAGGLPLESVVVQGVFLGLSAVAIPHILLHAIADRLGVDPFAAEAGS